MIFLDDLNTIVEAFKKTEARILFGAEAFCWPDKSLADKYPLTTIGKNYLNSGLYMGYLSHILELLNYKEVKDTDDDQLYFSVAYLDEKFRNKLKFKLDHNSEIFQNLNGATSKIKKIRLLSLLRDLYTECCGYLMHTLHISTKILFKRIKTASFLF